MTNEAFWEYIDGPQPPCLEFGTAAERRNTQAPVATPRYQVRQPPEPSFFDLFKAILRRSHQSHSSHPSRCRLWQRPVHKYASAKQSIPAFVKIGQVSCIPSSLKASQPTTSRFLLAPQPPAEIKQHHDIALAVRIARDMPRELIHIIHPDDSFFRGSCPNVGFDMPPCPKTAPESTVHRVRLAWRTDRGCRYPPN